jgi:hypothetical protein
VAEGPVFKQLEAVIDGRTTVICLHAAGQVRSVGEPYDTLAGQFDEPPFHVHCRSVSVPYLPGMTAATRDAANRELLRRPARQRAVADGRAPTRIPRPAVPAPVAPTARQTMSMLRGFAAPADKAEAAANRAALAESGPVGADVANVVSRWTGAGNEIEKVRAEIAAGGHGEFMAALRDGVEAPTLWRGVTSWDQASEDVITGARAGTEIDLGSVASFTTEQQHAQFFAGMDTRLVIQLDGAAGLPIQAISNSPAEAEWLMTGRVRITEIVSRRVTVDEEEGFTTVAVVARAEWIG